MNHQGRRRGNKGAVQTYRVYLTRDEAEELRALIRDEEGDADEDLLDSVYAAVQGRRTEPTKDVSIKITKKQREALFHVLNDEAYDSDEKYIEEALIALDLAIAKHSRNNH